MPYGNKGEKLSKIPENDKSKFAKGWVGKKLRGIHRYLVQGQKPWKGGKTQIFTIVWWHLGPH
jgi:hypothetical protein